MTRAKLTSNLLPRPIYESVADICAKRKIYKSATFFPVLLVPVDTGNGRTTIISETTDILRETKSIIFSSHALRYLEFKPNGTVDSIYRMDMEIQDNKATTYTNDFQGVVGVAGDSMLAHLNDSVGEKFFDLAERLKKKALLIIFVPSTANTRQVEVLAAKLGIGTKVFDPIKYDAEYLARLFYNLSSKFAEVPVRYEDCKERVASYIETNIPGKTLKNVLKSAEALLYNDEALKGIFCLSEKSIKRRMF